MEENFNSHIEEKTLSWIQKQEERKNITKDDKVVIYDLETVLQCPRGNSSAFYYKSILNCYNSTLTKLTKASSKKAYDKIRSYFWKESEEEKKNYSNNCCGQNKNKHIAT